MLFCVKASEFSLYLVFKHFVFCWLAERKSSLGHDWHPNCLRCESCNRMLNPGRHSEVLCVYVCVYVIMCVHAYVCMCVHVCVCVYCRVYACGRRG